MSLGIQQSGYFWADLLKQVDWYRDHAGSEVAERFVDAVEATLRSLAVTPGLGRPRFADWPESWQGFALGVCRNLTTAIWSSTRHDERTLLAERVLHGARDLPRRLLQSPYQAEP